MRFQNIRVMALLGGLAVAGCGASNINHGLGTGGSGGSGGSDGSGGSGGTGGGNTGGSGGSNNCGVMNFMLTKGGTPDLLVVLDRSGSMMESATGGLGGTGPSKWSSMTAALNQVVGQVSTVDWGLLFFSPVTSSSADDCSVPSTPDVACGANTASKITTAIGATKPGGGTPTPEALKAALQYFTGNSDGHSHYILLATDGLPSCSSDTDPQDAEAAVTAAATAGVKTIVVGIGNDPEGDATLTTMANNGGMPNTAAGQKPYYQVNTTTDLVTVLNKVAGQVVSCGYPLSMAPANPDFVEIDGNGAKIPHDKTHMNGWDYGPNDLSINFYGPACDALQKGVTTTVSAVFGCPPVG